MKHRIRIGALERLCEVKGDGQRFDVLLDGQVLRVEVGACGCMGDFRVVVNGEPLPLRIGGEGARALLGGQTVVQEIAGRELPIGRQAVLGEADNGGGATRKARVASGDVRAIMPGTVVRAVVAPGATVAKGDVLVILDAMKMENEIKAPLAGTVQELPVTAGQIVAKGDLLARIG